MKKLTETFKENKRVLIFCGRVVFLLVLFNYLNNYFESSGVHQWLIDVLGKSSTYILSIFGFSFYYDQSSIQLNGEEILLIGSTCDGLSFMALFLAFVVSYPARNLSKKGVFICIGILTIHLLNTIRTILLILNFQYHGTSFDFNHKYTFVVIVYGIVLWMWMVWAKRNVSKV